MLLSESEEVVTLRLLYIIIDSAFVAVAPLASVALTVKFEVPAAVGVPLISPVVLLRLSPAGSAPTVTAHVIGALPPLPASVWLYARFTVPSESDTVVITGYALTMIDKTLVAVALLSSVTCTVKIDIPAVVGVPLISPVALLSVTPTGSVPTVTVHVYGVFPPDACKR